MLYLISLQEAKPVQNAVRGRTKITQDEPPVNYVQLGSTKQTQGRQVVHPVKQGRIKALQVGIPFSVNLLNLIEEKFCFRLYNKFVT